MIKANELRLGNWALYPHTQREPFKIEYPRHIELADILDPIPITPEILEAAGFERQSVPADTYEIKAFDSYIRAAKHLSEFYFYVMDRKRNVLSEPQKYLHQLQNLYFSLTCEELTVRLLQA